MTKTDPNPSLTPQQIFQALALRVCNNNEQEAKLNNGNDNAELLAFLTKE